MYPTVGAGPLIPISSNSSLLPSIRFYRSVHGLKRRQHAYILHCPFWTNALAVYGTYMHMTYMTMHQASIVLWFGATEVECNLSDLAR